MRLWPILHLDLPVRIHDRGLIIWPADHEPGHTHDATGSPAPSQPGMPKMGGRPVIGERIRHKPESGLEAGLSSPARQARQRPPPHHRRSLTRLEPARS